MNRYEYTTSVAGKYLTSRLTSPNISGNDLYIFSREGDRLDLLANSFYNNPQLWWVIADANNLGKGSMIVPPGIQIRIPRTIEGLDILLRQLEQNK